MKTYEIKHDPKRTQNPTLTFMTLTARAANYAVEELNKMNL
jgi:hypothetical protein